MSDCLHCDINELVQKRLEGGEDPFDVAAKMLESLAELILLAPETDQPKLMAEAIAHFGHMFLEKSSAIDDASSSATH